MKAVKYPTKQPMKQISSQYFDEKRMNQQHPQESMKESGSRQRHQIQNLSIWESTEQN